MCAEPRAAYRVQLHPGFDFDAAAAIAPYLAELGVSHVYTSPILEAEPGSAHGYDVVDHGTVRRELGGEAGLARFLAALDDHGLRWMLDVVPNHMSVASHRNAWWWDVLTHGPQSAHAPAFDIDWMPDRPQVVLPILGDALDLVLARDELRVVHAADGSAELHYFDRRLPLAPGTYATGTEPVADLLARQHYRLVWWRRGAFERNYRCFFDIAGLAAVRVEDPGVFAATHALLARWVRDGVLDAIRVDHIDGLADPAEYLGRLRALAPDAWIVVEKILAVDEHLAASWPVDGTTGYEFARLTTGLFVDGRSEATFTRLAEDLTGDHDDWRTIATRAEHEVITTRLAADVAKVGRLLAEVAATAHDAALTSATPAAAATVVEALLVHLDVYRTYVRPGRAPSPEDVRRVTAAADAVRASGSGADPRLLDLAQRTLTGGVDGPAAARFVTAFQQLSGPVMAKGDEDTALYRYQRLLALNQVGGAPDHFGVEPPEFHRRCETVARSWPRTLLTGSTHDSKRSQDARARLSLLTEIPQRWEQTARTWFARSEGAWRGASADRSAQYFVFQTLVSAWPIEPERVLAYVQKAARESGVRTSWTEPDAAYETALTGFVATLLADAEFTRELDAFVESIAVPAEVSTLAQVLLRLTAPGVPDVYQGDELWMRTLVDPDNRRPVDFDARRALLADVAARSWAAVVTRRDAGSAKLWLIHRVLQVRAARAASFGPAAPYRRVRVDGERAGDFIAFGRGDDVVVVAARRVATRAAARERHTLALPPGAWRDALRDKAVGGGTVPVIDLLDDVPLALLVREASVD